MGDSGTNGLQVRLKQANKRHSDKSHGAVSAMDTIGGIVCIANAKPSTELSLHVSLRFSISEFTARFATNREDNLDRMERYHSLAGMLVTKNSLRQYSPCIMGQRQYLLSHHARL